MCEVFGDKRAQFQRLVDQQTRAAAEVPIDPMTSSSSMARIRTQEVPLLGGELGVDGAPSMRLPSSASRIKPPSFDGTGSGPSAIAAHTLVSDRPPMRKRHRWVPLFAIGAALALIGGAVVVRANAPHDVGASGAPAAAAPSPSPDPGVAAPAAPPAAALDDKPAASASASAVVAAPPPGGAVATGDPTVKRVISVPYRPALGAHARASSAEARPSAPAAETAPPPKREVDCTSPYFIDDQGMKKVRVECL
jgi:hypothetical protein